MRASSDRRVDLPGRVRFILVRHLIDTSRLSIMVSLGVVYLRGSLERLSGVGSPLTADLVGTIITEVGRVDRVQRVVPEFDNWVQTGTGPWKPVEKKQASAPGIESTTEIPSDEETP